MNDAQLATDAKLPLPYTEFNTEAKRTLALIHGGFDTGASWRGVIEHLPFYHLLVPDLPGHGRARESHPKITAAIAAHLIADLIRTHAKNGGKAYIVGLSVGAHVAIAVASLYPEVVDDVVFASGFNVIPPMSHPFVSLFSLLNARVPSGISKLLAKRLFSIKDIDEQQKVEEAQHTFTSHRQIVRIICVKDYPKPWPARTLIVVAGGGSIPDQGGTALKLRDIGRQRNPATVAYTHREMGHPWHCQDPKLFAQAVRAWIEGEALPRGFEEL